jgi:hypothetical protein
MNTIYLRNAEIEPIIVCLTNGRQRGEQKEDGVNGLVSLKISKIIKDLRTELEDYSEEKQKLLDKYVKGGSADPEVSPQGEYIFNSEEDKQKFIDVSGAYVSVQVRELLDDVDLDAIYVLSREIEYISKVTRTEANFKNPDPTKPKEEKKKDS